MMLDFCPPYNILNYKQIIRKKAKSEGLLSRDRITNEPGKLNAES